LAEEMKQGRLRDLCWSFGRIRAFWALRAVDLEILQIRDYCNREAEQKHQRSSIWFGTKSFADYYANENFL